MSQVVLNEKKTDLFELKQRIIGLNNILFHINDAHEYINYNSTIQLVCNYLTIFVIINMFCHVYLPTPTETPLVTLFDCVVDQKVPFLAVY